MLYHVSKDNTHLEGFIEVNEQTIRQQSSRRIYWGG